MARRVAARAPAPDDVFVVSVGNLALGGTGKTPVTLALARDLDRAALVNGQDHLHLAAFRAGFTEPNIVEARANRKGPERCDPGMAGERWDLESMRLAAGGLNVEGEGGLLPDVALDVGRRVIRQPFVRRQALLVNPRIAARPQGGEEVSRRFREASDLRQIERQQLGETDVPPPIEPVDGVLM